MLVIPTSRTEAHYEQTTPLDGRTYVLRFDWHQRTSRWYLTVYTQDREVLADGLALVPNYPIGKSVLDARWFPGTLIVLSADGEPPGLEDFHPTGRCFLAYIPAGV